MGRTRDHSRTFFDIVYDTNSAYVEPKHTKHTTTTIMKDSVAWQENTLARFNPAYGISRSRSLNITTVVNEAHITCTVVYWTFFWKFDWLIQLVLLQVHTILQYAIHTTTYRLFLCTTVKIMNPVSIEMSALVTKTARAAFMYRIYMTQKRVRCLLTTPRILTSLLG